MNALIALALTAAPAWTVEIGSSGGFAGRGAGGVTVSADGRATVEAMGGARCEGLEAPKELMAALEAAVKAAKPAAWKERYVLPANPNGCCDQFQTTLALVTRREGVEARREATWYDDSRGLRPADLAKVEAAAQAIGSSLKARCQK